MTDVRIHRTVVVSDSELQGGFGSGCSLETSQNSCFSEIFFFACWAQNFCEYCLQVLGPYNYLQDLANEMLWLKGKFDSALWTYIINSGFVPKLAVVGGRFSVYNSQSWTRPSPVLIVLLKKAMELRNFKNCSKLKCFLEAWSEICCHKLISFFFFSLASEGLYLPFHSSDKLQRCSLRIGLYFLYFYFLALHGKLIPFWTIYPVLVRIQKKEVIPTWLWPESLSYLSQWGIVDGQ